MNIQLFNIDEIQQIFKITEKLNRINDLNSLLDQVLFYARMFTNADAGTIYLVEGDNLRFAYTQNDTFIRRTQLNKKQIYADIKIPINANSIAGYVAKCRKSLKIDDVYELENHFPFSFNRQFDENSNYRTMSMLTIPLIVSEEKVIGVIQIINAIDPNSGEVVPFTAETEMFVSFFANIASAAIEKAKMTREMILRMIKMAELRDPKETGSHVQRVSSYSVEVYQKWAKNHDISDEEIRKKSDVLRIAAMLHDVGKIGIPDVILKKPARLDEEEYEIMKTHTNLGGDLFINLFNEVDEMSRDVAVCHHERWDGKGYPKGLAGEDIPLAGRIVAIADVYDALMSKRVYKSAWSEDDVLKYLREQAGTQFDPELIEVFISVYDIIKAIRNRYSE
ncbi:MAG: HD domain-containing protein [Spirochaetales bacterium]|nr:HD domain-containing protein [Spirochaetales bacterium]